MLFCKVLHSPDQKAAVYEAVGDSASLWVVKDLESKFWVQEWLQEQRGPIINTDCVLRASELWQSLLLKKDPSWQPLSEQMIEFLIEKWMDEIVQEQGFRVSSKDRSRASQTIGQILPLIGHFHGENIMEQWFAEKEDAKERWEDWYRLGKALWQRFMEKKIVPQEWMKGVLINEELPTLTESSIVVDLGVQIDDVESELFLNLSRKQDVYLLIPRSESDKEAYQALMARGQVETFDEAIATYPKTYKKLPSMLAEVKEAVSNIRRWLDLGIEPQRLAIVSPQIENYWPTLQEHLLVEGVPVSKGVATPLSQIPVYQAWLSKLRMASQRLQVGDPEQVMFTEVEEPSIDFRDFKSLYSNIYDVEDLERRTEVKKKLPPFLPPERLYSLTEFFETTIAWVDCHSLKAFDRLLEGLDAICALDETLSFEKWVEFFEKYLSRNEKKIADGQAGGVQVLPLMAAHNPPLDKVILLGLSEQNLLESHDTALQWKDVESIKINFGFNLPHSDRHQRQDELSWFMAKNLKEVILTHGETDFSGQFQAPSLYWLQGAMEQNQTELVSPGASRWDQVMRRAPRQDLPWSSAIFEKCERSIARDQGEESVAPVPYRHLSLSATSLEQYFKCPFKFFAEKGLKLREDPLIDLDIDRRSRGQLLHKICEKIVKNKMWSFNEQQAEKLVEECRKDLEFPVYTEKVWHFLKPFYIRTALQFREAEVQWRQKFPSTESVALEHFVETCISLQGEDIRFQSESGVPFRGVIDRVDQNSEGQTIIVDYKSTFSSLYQYGSWLSKGQIQLLIYSLALMEGVLGDQMKNVVGACYYALNKMDRTRGFLKAGTASDFAEVGKPLGEEKLKELLSKTRALLVQLVTELEGGRIEPAPKLELDKDLCKKCDWKQICRYPTLNL